jgi:Pin2-interacting protein X1
MSSSTPTKKGHCYQGVEKESFAYNMMHRLGWQEGQGLGAKGQGITSHIKTKKKDDFMGVGRLEADKKAVDWTINNSTYDQILSKLRAAHEDDAHAPSTSTKAPSDSKKEAKKREKEEKRKSKKTKRLVRAQGRYKKRESAKFVKNYSATDLAAILGHSNPGDDVFGQIATATAPKDKEEEVKNQAPPLVIVVQVPKNEKMASYKPVVLAENWWGNHMFTQSTHLLGDQEVKTKKLLEDNQFTEEDQENIYTNAHKIGTQNRQGLGMSSRMKIAGGNWSGKKMSFAENENENSDESSDDQLQVQEKSSADSKNPTREGDDTNLSKSRLKELIVKALKKKKDMKASKLKSSVFKLGSILETVANVDKFFKVLQNKSKKFSYDGKRVKLSK